MINDLNHKLLTKTHEIARQDTLLRLVSFVMVGALGVSAVVAIQLWSSVAEKEQIITQLQRSISDSSYICKVSGPGLQSTTVNNSTHVILELCYSSGQPYLVEQMVTAELQIQSVDQSFILPTTVSMKSPSQYEVSYRVHNRGQHQLHVQLDGGEIRGSPFNITVYPDPTKLGTPERIVTGLDGPWGIAINSHGEIVVSNVGSGRVLLLDNSGKVIRAYGSVGDRSGQMKYPTGVTIDSDDNVYVAGDQKVHLFSRDGHFKDGIRYWLKNEEHTYFRGIALHHSFVYVCDRGNHRIVVFDADINFIKIMGSRGSRMRLQEPYDLDFDSEGKLYISDKHNHHIKVIDTNGQFLRQIGQEEGKGKLKMPTAVHIMGQFVYVTDQGHDRIAVYRTSGQFITSFGKHGKGKGQFDAPLGITSDKNGFLYVADYNNDRVQVF